MGLLLHDLEPGAGDQLGDGAAERRSRGRVAAAGEDERRGGDLRQAVCRVMIEERVEVALQVLGPLFMREGEHFFDELGDGPVVVRPRGVDVEEEPLKERTLAGGELDKPARETGSRSEGRYPAPARCSAGPGCGPVPGDGAPAPGR